MNVVSFYAPRPDHPFFQDYIPYLRILDESCRKYGHKHIVITDASSLEDLNTFHADMPQDLMQAILAGQLAYLESGLASEDTLLCGADCVLAQDPAAAFAVPFDIACTTHPFTDCILNTGAIFIRGGANAAPIWRRALEGCGKTWGDDQLSLAAELNPTLEHGLYDRAGLKVRFLPVDPWNLAPEFPGDACEGAVMLHFRGPRKAWMADHCAKVLGVGEPQEVIALCNTPDEELFANILTNGMLDLPWLSDSPAHDEHVVIVGGGPSLAETLPEIKWRQSVGQKVVALNGSADWLKDNGVVPDWHIVLDPRKENARFVSKLAAKKYLIASQCHPVVFDALFGADVTLFHPAIPDIGSYLPSGRDYTMIGGGISSGLTAMAVVYALGFRQIHLYGYDSSDRESEAHAYSQSETEKEKARVEVWCGGKRFVSSITMYAQAEKFPEFAQMLANEGCVITVHGDGLLPTIARQMAA